jgi:micrococcal nuclease
MRIRLALAGVVTFAATAAGQTRDPTRSAPADSGPRAPIRAVTPCVVLRVVDGDTIRCEDSGLVRLIGMDSPEANQPPFGAAATAALRTMLAAGDTVQLEPDVEARDRYGRILAYVWRGDSMLNWRMVRLGWAVVLTYPPNVQYADRFVSAQAKARVEVRGLWRVDGFRCLPVERRRKTC